MRVFISSVRGGLEVERDALPGLLKAVGHEPVRFEDFTAQPEPSRQACMDGVDNSDVYVLLLGPRYGHRFPDTNQSPTHDEYVRARTRGIPKLVFLKAGVDPDPDQVELIDQIRNYATGSFYDSFTDVGDLLPKVAAALAEVATRPSSLTWEPLDGDLDGGSEGGRGFTWHSDWRDPRLGSSLKDPTVELHIKPLEWRPIPARLMAANGARLVDALRESGAISAQSGVEVDSGDVAVTVEVPAQRRSRFDEARPRQLRGVRIDAGGQLSVWWSLPGDGMGGILNEGDLLEALTTFLRWAGAVGVDAAQRYAIAVGVTGSMISVVGGQLSSQSRSQASLSMSDEAVRVLPDESVSAAAFDAGAPEVARDLTTKLLMAFSRRR